MKKPNVDVSIETINPGKAEEYLKLTTRNRHITAHHLAGLVNDMKNNRWVFNGDPVRFNGNTLIDGQHRLTAIVKSGRTQEFVVIRQLTKEAFDTIDIGRRRKTSDYLSMDGKHYPQTLSSASRWIIAYRKYKNFGTHEPITHKEKMEVIAATPLLENYVNAYAGGRLEIRMSVAMVCALHILFHDKHSKQADEFMDGLTSGLELTSIDPRYIARQWIVRNRERTTNVFTREAGNMIVNAWNHFRGGEPMSARPKRVEITPEIA